MRELASAMKRLDTVRRAGRHFLTLWAAEVLLSQSSAIDRLADDLREAEEGVADPHNHDWSLLYRGSVLDD